MPKYNDFELDVQKVEVSSLNFIGLSVNYSNCDCQSFVTERYSECECFSNLCPEM